MDQLLIAALEVLPLGVIVVDAQNRVVAWNAKAEEFIAAVGRPTLHEGMTLDSAHPEAAAAGMSAMIQGLRNGRRFPHKRVAADGGRVFDVAYETLLAADGTFIGVAQVISQKEKG